MTGRLAEIERKAREADRLSRRANELLTSAVRSAIADGFTQREVAQAIGRSQPEVSRLLRFRGRSPLGLKLRAKRGELISLLATYGMRDVRVFGSVATETDTPDSDIDLLVKLAEPVGLFTLARAEHDASVLLGAQVELTPDRTLQPYLRDRVAQEAIPI